MPPKKDPNKPKGKMSAYAYFVQEKRAEYKAEGKDVEFTAFSKECSERWKKVDEEDKKIYTSQAEKDKVRYDREMKDYVPPDGVKKGRKAKKERDPNLPKRAMSAFFFFAADKRPKLKSQHPGATVGDIAKQLGAAWKLMTDEQKHPYQESASKERSKYTKAMEDFRKGVIPKKITQEDEEEEEYSEED